VATDWLLSAKGFDVVHFTTAPPNTGTITQNGGNHHIVLVLLNLISLTNLPFLLISLMNVFIKQMVDDIIECEELRLHRVKGNDKGFICHIQTHGTCKDLIFISDSHTDFCKSKAIAFTWPIQANIASVPLNEVRNFLHNASHVAKPHAQ
jgi:hypothetical protein